MVCQLIMQILLMLIYHQVIEIKETIDKFPLSYFLTFTVNMTIANFSPEIMTKETTFNFAIINVPHLDSDTFVYQSLPHMKFVFHSLISYIRPCNIYPNFFSILTVF